MPRITVLLVAAALVARPPRAQRRVTATRQALGFDGGADYPLATYTQLEAYWRTLARESPRMALREIGKTAEGRPQLMAIITAPENHKRLAHYQDIARRLTRAEGLSDGQAHALARDGKAVVWIDGGLHATEVLGAHQLMELVYQMVSRDDPETRRILDDVILLAVHANPDGMELVSSWYMREADSLKRSTAGIPRLYQKYIGHDNNRDFYMVTQPETEHMARVMFREWFPQIVYNHHQTGPAGTVLFAPPFRDPFNYYFDPLVPIGIDMVAAAMHERFLAEGKPGATMRSGAPYSTWWNGGLRTTAYFHNMIGLLTEAIGNPTPIDIPFVPDRALPKGDLPAPIEPQQWHFRQSIDYSTATKFVNTLIKNGVTVLRAAGDFDVAGRHYPAQSYIVPAAQAFRPHVLDMFEPQDHPNDFQFPGGPPIPPYDNAGWTLAYQMGVSFDRILDRFDGSFEPVRDTATPPPGTVSHADGATGFLLSHRVNDAAIATNRLLAKGEEVDWLVQPVAANGRDYPAGTIFIPATPASIPLVRGLATDLGLSFDGLATRPAPALRVRPVRIGLWDRYGGSIPSGWTRWLLERFEFPFEVVYPPTLDAGKLADRYDVLVFPDGAIPQNDRDQPDDFFGPPPQPETIPAEFKNRLGRVSVQKTVPLLGQFLTDGSTLIAIGSSTGLGQHIGLPLASHLVSDGKPLPRSKFYVPGSLLQARVDTTRPLTYGMPGRVDVFFDNSPVFDLRPDAAVAGVRPLAWVESAHPLRSGSAR